MHGWPNDAAITLPTNNSPDSFHLLNDMVFTHCTGMERYAIPLSDLLHGLGGREISNDWPLLLR
jgi:hypothetical protein